jgi:hypothetical protein
MNRLSLAILLLLSLCFSAVAQPRIYHNAFTTNQAPGPIRGNWNWVGTNTLDSLTVNKSLNATAATNVVFGGLTAASFTGNGSSITNIQAANIIGLDAFGGGDFMADGSVAMEGPLDLGGNAITNAGSISVTGAVTAASFTGNAAGLTNIPTVIHAADFGASAAASSAVNAAAIQAALDVATNGAVVMLPLGNVYVTGYPLEVKHSGTTVRGYGSERTKLFTTSTTVDVWTNSNMTRCTFENFSVQKFAKDDTSTTAAFRWMAGDGTATSASRVEFRNIKVLNFHTAWYMNHVIGATWINCEAYQNVIGWYGDALDAGTWIGCTAGDGMNSDGFTSASGFGALTNDSRGWLFQSNSKAKTSKGNTLIGCEGRRAARLVDAQIGWITLLGCNFEVNTSNHVYVANGAYVTIQNTRLLSVNQGNNLVECASAASQRLTIINSQFSAAPGYYDIAIRETGTLLPTIIGEQKTVTNVTAGTTLTLTAPRVAPGTGVTVTTNGAIYTVSATNTGSSFPLTANTDAGPFALTNLGSLSVTGAVTAGTFAGDGGSITNILAANIVGLEGASATNVYTSAAGNGIAIVTNDLNYTISTRLLASNNITLHTNAGVVLISAEASGGDASQWATNPAAATVDMDGNALTNVSAMYGGAILIETDDGDVTIQSSGAFNVVGDAFFGNEVTVQSGVLTIGTNIVSDAGSLINGVGLTNGAVTAASFTGNGAGLTNLNGTNIVVGTINSNKLDEATLALLGTGGSGDASAWSTYPATTNVYFGGNDITNVQNAYIYGGYFGSEVQAPSMTLTGGTATLGAGYVTLSGNIIVADTNIISGAGVLLHGVGITNGVITAGSYEADDMTVGTLTVTEGIEQSSLPYSWLPFTWTGTTNVLNPTNGLIQRIVLTNPAAITMSHYNVTNTESIRLELVGSNAVTFVGGLSNATALTITGTNYATVWLFDKAAGETNWWGSKLR